MDWNRVEGAWKEFRGKAKERWGQLSDDDLTLIGGKRDELIGKLQSRYGYSIDRARQEIDDWLGQISNDAAAMTRRASEAKARATEVVDNFSVALRKSIQDSPGATLALVAGLAFVIGALWKS
jgi:uncharacterized protein YjbJ (UPF0337 family)